MAKVNGFTIPGALLNRAGTDVSSSVGTVVVYMDSIPVLGGTFKSDDVVQIQAAMTRATTAVGTMNLLIYWNDTPDVVTPILLGQSTGASGDEYIAISRNICIVNSTTTLVFNTGGAQDTDMGNIEGSQLTNAVSTITSIDWNTDGYIVFAASDSNTQTITKRYLTVLK